MAAHNALGDCVVVVVIWGRLHTLFASTRLTSAMSQAFPDTRVAHIPCISWCLLQDAWLRGAPISGFPHYSVLNKPPSSSVIGSQPVSLDRENLELLRRKR